MIDSMKVFCMVVNQNGFRAAANELDMSPAMVSRHIAKLEFELKTSLLKRNTRSLTLTDAGESFYQRCGQIVSLYEQCLHQSRHDNKSISGHLKVGIPHSISQLYVIPALESFYRDYPEITLDIIAGNHCLELFSHGYDLALHCGPLPDSALYYTLIGYWRKQTVASPNYLQKHGTPSVPDELNMHSCLCHFDNRSRSWRYVVEQQNVDVPVFGRTRINSSLQLSQLALAGQGIAYLPDFTVKRMLVRGELTSILEDYMPSPLPMYVVHINPQPSKREQLFIDFLKTLSLAEVNS